MSRHKASNAELLLKAPWWVSAALGIFIFIAMRWLIPAFYHANQIEQTFSGAVRRLAPVPVFVFGLFAVGSFIFAQKRHRLVEEQTSLEKLRATGWKDFEYLVAEAFRRQGYQVDYSLGQGADGGIDLTLRKDGRTSLVQCKQWKIYSVGAPVIREMFGLMTAEKADEAIIVTTGKFTRDAQVFAGGKPIRLIDGPQLLALVQSVQSANGGTLASGAAADSLKNSSPSPLRGEGRGEVASGLSSQVSPLARDAITCPLCGKPMVQRTAKRGANAGNQFWGCSTYPACKGTHNG